MAHRAEKKRQLREERLAREQAAGAAERRRLLFGRIGAGVLALAAVAAVVVAIVAGGSSDGAKPSSGGAAPAVAIPSAKQTDLTTAARTAGCQVRNFPNFGQEHTTDKVSYKSNPPTSGPHNPIPAQDGAYAAADSPPVGQSVHALEHGRVEIQWKRGLTRREIGQLQSVFNERDGYHALLFENRTSMPYAVAISAWQHFMGCPRLNSAAIDAIRAFRGTYTDKAPERVP